MTLNTAWVALSIQQGIGGRTFQALLSEFGNAEAVLAATIPQLKTVHGVGQRIAEYITQIDLPTIEKQLDKWQSAGVTIIAQNDAQYPAYLQTLDDAPPVIFVRGMLQALHNKKTAAIVGTRNPSDEAREMAFALGQALVRQGYTVVSGLAKGIDTAAHEGALSHDEGHTLAITGSGVLQVYPPENAGLATRIMQQGALLSESAPDATVNAARLVARNRLISGFSQHIFVIESKADGGAMHTARFAHKQQRTVYAATFSASGNLQLLREGAIALTPDLNALTRLLESSSY